MKKRKYHKTMYKRHRKKQVIKELGKDSVITLFILMLLWFGFSKMVFALPKNEGYAMRTVLNDGDRVYVNRFGKPKRFSLVYFKLADKNQYSIRRIIGLPGESLTYSNDALSINNQLVVERFLQKKLLQSAINNEVITDDFDSEAISGTVNGVIPQGKYLVLGDNRKYATDSRYYGLIDKKAIIGVVEMRWWPFYMMKKI